MVRSFDPTDLSLSGAADMVAIRVTLGVAARPAMTKEAGVIEDLMAKIKGMDNPLANFDISNPAHAAMLGGGIGAGGGLLATIMSKRKKKRWLRNMLLGGALGAGVGGAGSYMAKNLPGMWDTETTKLTERAKVIEATLGKMRSGKIPATSEQLAALVAELNGIKKKIDPPTIDSPDAASRMGTLSLNLGEGDVGSAAKNIWEWGKHDVTNKPVDVAASTLAGGAAGMGVDWLRAKRYARTQAARQEARMTKPITATEMRDPAMQEKIPKNITEQIAESKAVPPPKSRPGFKPKLQPGRPQTVTGVGTPSLPSFSSSAVKPSAPIVSPLLGPSGTAAASMPIPRPPKPITGSGGIFEGMDLQKYMEQWQSNAERVRRETAARERVAKPTTRASMFLKRSIPIKLPGPKWRHAGKFTGGVFGGAASLFSDWGSNPAEAERQ